MSGTGRAVEADDVDRQRVKRRRHGANIGSQQHPAGDVERRLGLDGDAPQAAVEFAHDAGDGGFHFEQILAGLEQQQIDAALHEIPGLLAVQIGEFVEGDLRKRRIRRGDEHPRRPHRAGHEARAVGRRVAIGGFAREARAVAVDVGDPMTEAVLVELEPRRGERIGFHDVGAGREIVLVDPPDEVRPSQDQRLVAAVIRRASESLVRQLERHELCPDRTIKDEYATVEGIQVGETIHAG